ncbi:hypothetical protein [Lentibacillus salinarum]|uniref:ABC-2 transporter permease n=1 Tax=Lentibacillus salinarum TaxID=446820 RepID=A0ABW3ZTH4_9BACI
MKDWKEAYRLAMFEIKKSKWSFPISFVVFVLIGLSIGSLLGDYLDNSYVGPDFIFVLLFTFMPAWAKPKDFQIKQLNGGMWVPPPVIMLKQLPVKENVLIKSRFIIYYIFSLPIQVVFLLILYASSPGLRDVLPPGSYVAFSIIWLAFSFYIGGILPASDAGTITNTGMVTLYGIMILLGFITVLTFIHMITGQGIVYWTVIVAEKWSIVSSVISIILAFFGATYWRHNMRQTIRKMDYL